MRKGASKYEDRSPAKTRNAQTTSVTRSSLDWGSSHVVGHRVVVVLFCCSHKLLCCSHRVGVVGIAVVVAGPGVDAMGHEGIVVEE